MPQTQPSYQVTFSDAITAIDTLATSTTVDSAHAILVNELYEKLSFYYTQHPREHRDLGRRKRQDVTDGVELMLSGKAKNWCMVQQMLAKTWKAPSTAPEMQFEDRWPRLQKAISVRFKRLHGKLHGEGRNFTLPPPQPQAVTNHQRPCQDAPAVKLSDWYAMQCVTNKMEAVGQ